jgi:CRISPR-associated endonuclease/helicase Cas3
MRTSPQALTIVNTKRDAFALMDALNDHAALHLSTQMCGAHRRQTLREVWRRLQAGELCRLVSTQVVEAGVDFDFPLVLRAIGPLDRIVQAAGRCNREGRLALGRVVVFDPAEGTSPQGVYRSGMNTAESLLAAGCDLDDPATYETYFCRLFQVTETDAKKIQATRESLNYPSVAERFRMIDDDSTPVVVQLEAFRAEVDEVVSMIRRNGEVPRWAFRRLQPFLVNLRSRLISAYEAKGLVQEIAPGLWEWLGGYDPIRGLVEGSRDPDDLVI